jgi:hypothetical protein
MTGRPAHPGPCGSSFLRDFGYDPELLRKNQIDHKVLVDLWGVVKVSEATWLDCNTGIPVT